MTQVPRRPPLPLAALVAADRAAPPAGEPPFLLARDWLTGPFLDSAADADLLAALDPFAAAVQPVPFHPHAAARRVRFVRHALNHLLRGHDPLPDRLARCVTPGEVYFVPGLGPAFWSAVAKALDPDALPLWCPATERGLARLGLFRPAGGVAARFAAVLRGYEAVRAEAPDWTATRADVFLERVARMAGRELPPGPPAWGWQPDPRDVERALRTVRTRHPLRKRLREADPGAAAVLPEPALARLDDAYSPALPPDDRAALGGEVAAVLRGRFRVHPLELADVLTELGEDSSGPGFQPVREDGFAGFCSDTFRFLAELEADNRREWMTAQRERYQFAVREPLVELCGELAARYIRPVLNREYGWELEADARPGRAITSIVKNDFGRGGPYQTVQWVTFYRRSQAHRRADAQFFVRVAADGVSYGFHLGRSARDAGRQFRRNIQDHADPLFAALSASGVVDGCRFWTADDLSAEVPVRTPADLRQWAVNKTLLIGKRLPPDAGLLRRDELVGDVLLTFDRLVPAFASAAEADPRPLLHRRAGAPDGPPPFDRPAFLRDTFLSDPWLDRVLGLLQLKRQLVLQGVPGTGKTHIARGLARLLARDRPDAVRLVQFHPAYSYEEFVEGIKARAVEANGQSQVTFPVEDGVLTAFAARAALHPSEPHVLVIDELNRGNLPRIFGELLYLLEYRDQEVILPYSKRAFRLPDNLYLIATMNTADRSAVALDQALRRRFSFVDVPPDPALLSAWLERFPPTDADAGFGPRVVRAFEELNRRLARDLGPDRQVGHSFLMVPGLDAGKLLAVWDHHIRPLLLDYFGGRAERVAGYEFDRLTGEKAKRPRRTAIQETET